MQDRVSKKPSIDKLFLFGVCGDYILNFGTPVGIPLVCWDSFNILFSFMWYPGYSFLLFGNPECLPGCRLLSLLCGIIVLSTTVLLSPNRYLVTLTGTPWYPKVFLRPMICSMAVHAATMSDLKVAVYSGLLFAIPFDQSLICGVQDARQQLSREYIMHEICVCIVCKLDVFP